VEQGLEQGIKMRISLAVVVVVASVSVGSLAQQSQTFKVKHSATEKAPKSSVPIAKTAGPATASAANAKDLQALEHQTARASAPARSGAKRTPGKASALKPVKEKPNPPINFGGSGGGKNAGMVNQGANPYKGRLKQKHAHAQ